VLCSTSRSARSTPRSASNCGAGCATCTNRPADHAVRHPRPGRGAGTGRPRGRAARRPHRAGRHTRRDLQRAGIGVRVRLHRTRQRAGRTRRSGQFRIDGHAMPLPADVAEGDARLYARPHDMASAEPRMACRRA
jgi:hypothetical protein